MSICLPFFSSKVMSVIAILLAALLLPPSSALHNLREFVCVPCQNPGAEIDVKLHTDRRCLEKGQKLFHWSNVAKADGDICAFPTFLPNATMKIGVDPETSSVYLQNTVCIDYFGIALPYRVFCKNVDRWVDAKLRVLRQSPKKVNPLDVGRRKRWLRRRNHKVLPIHFQQERYVIDVSEDVPVKTVVAKLQAVHEKDQPLYYSMLAPEDSRSMDLFSLDTTNGEITVAKSLDRETLAKHVFKVTVYERLDPSVSTSTNVVVNVKDVQDNSPIFEKNVYFAEIREDAPIGTTVISVFASDPDEGPNGTVHYSLSDGEGSDLLSIDSKSGVISTQKQLDRETLSFIRLNVIATDAGVPPLSSQAMIELTINDVNDNAPVFEQKFYNITVFENVTIPSVIAKIYANDLDAGQNGAFSVMLFPVFFNDSSAFVGKVHYSIVTTSTSDLFYLDYDTGELSIKQAAQPRQSPLSLIIRAKDGGHPSHSSTVHCQVNILDVNDHAPQYIVSGNDGHTILVEESVPIGREIGRIFAVDEDFGENGDVRYEVIEDDSNGAFNLDATSGAITTAIELDRETRDKYKLRVAAKDRGNPPLNTTADLSIIVKDVNDNVPTFEHKVYNLTLSENTPRGSKLLQLVAKDADLDQKVVYNIEKMPKKQFTLVNLGENGAILSLAQEFQPTDHAMEVVVSATDQGGLQGKCIVRIVIDDVNTPPRFIDNPVSVKIPENSPIGFHVVKMITEDTDREENAQLTFKIDSDKFQIDPSSGLISTKAVLDREEQSMYAVSIEVSDSGTPPMSSSTVLEIILVDENDNAPEFSEPQYEVRILENIAVGTSFLQLKATDPDEGANGIVNYFLNESDPTVELDHFRLDQTSGLLRVNRPLDREKLEAYVLPVTAMDRGDPPQKTMTTISIILVDVNDNAPQFEKQSYDFWVAENSPQGTLVGTLKASDPDDGENAKIEFRIVGGRDAQLFDIEADPTEAGVVKILARTEFDYEAKANRFTIELQASSGQLSSTVPVTIHVSDVNDNRPQLKDFLALITTFNGDSIDVNLGSMPAYDPDHNATLEHYLEENDVIAVEEFSGKLILKTGFNRQINMEQKACVSDGPNTVCARCHISYVSVTEESLRESVTIRIHGLKVDEFLELSVYRRFLDAMASVSTKWLQEYFRIFSVKPESDWLNISFFVSVDDNILSLRRVEETILENVRRVSSLFGHKVDVLDDELCNDEPCPYFQKCRRSLKYVRNSRILEAETFVMRSLDTIRTFSCECPTGFTTNENLPGLCNQQIDLCYNSPCLHNGTCISLENSFRCKCEPDRTGPRCEFPLSKTMCTSLTCKNGAECHLQDGEPVCRYCRWQQPDADEFCRLRALSFGGNGSVIIPRMPGRYEWDLSLSIATVSGNGVILYTGDRRKSDFLEVSIENGLPRVEISLGGESKTAVKMPDWPENRVNDGEWHTLKLKYADRKLRLSVDDCDDHLSLTMARRIGYKHCAVETKIDLPSRCLDASVPCHRSLDLNLATYLGNLPASQQSTSKMTPGFIGCVRDFYLDGNFVDFSDFETLEKFGDASAGCQRYRPDRCKYAQPCDGGSRCVDRWQGHLCQCNQRTSMTAPSCALETTSVISLFSDEAYAMWRLPASFRSPLTLHFEFRTRERKTQVVVLEFDLKSHMFLFSVENGHALIRIGADQYFMPFPTLADASWHFVDVVFKKSQFEVTIDQYNSKTFALSSHVSGVPQQLYSGQAPSTSYPHAFQGCIRNIELNGIKLKVLESSQTRPNCQVPNACTASTDACPKKSSCVRDWDRHNCICNRGYVGDSCIDVCSIAGICNNEGLCVRANSTRGYECLCPEGFKGPNCEQRDLPKVCPAGWFGSYPHCQKCGCLTRRGFKQQCDKLTGQCLCQSGTFLEKGRCKPCECGYGSTSPMCNTVTGQCPCSGESIGRRCDRCRSATAVLDRKTLKCVRIKERCPAQIEGGIQWPSTLHGVVARQSCPRQQMGIATRKCTTLSEWESLNDYNCTLSQLYDLNIKVSDKFDVFDAGRQLLNLTSNMPYIKNKNVDLAINIFEGIVVAEAKNSLGASRRHSRHVRDSQFTKNIVDIGDVLFDQLLKQNQFDKLITILYDYGVLLSSVHEAANYLKPFQVMRANLVFAVDLLDSRKYPNNVFNLPKYDQFAPPEPEIDRISQAQIDYFHAHRITVIGHENFAMSTVFYSVVTKPQCYGCEHSLVMVHHLTAAEADPQPETIQVTFASGDVVGWRLPECVWLDFDSQLLASNGADESKENGVFDKLTYAFKSDIFSPEPKGKSLQWRNDHATLIGLNNTHVTCQYSLVSGGIFTVLIKPDSGSIIQFSLYSGEIPLTSPLLAAISMFFCVMALLVALFRQHLQTRIIRCTIILAFIFNLTVMFVTQKITITTTFCPVRNSLLTFGISFLFSWLFIYALHIYHSCAEGRPRSCKVLYGILGVLTPLALTATTFITAPTCSLTATTSAFWLIVTPLTVFLLLSFYAVATSFLISMNKKYNLIAAKFDLKKAVIVHSLMSLCCAFYNILAIFSFVRGHQNDGIELFTGVMSVIASAVLFYWSNWCPEPAAFDETDKANLWTNQEFPMSDPTAGLPILDAQKTATIERNHYQNRIYDGPPGEWVPDMISSETYVHHTLQRSLQLPPMAQQRRLASTSGAAQIPQILSPAQKVFGSQAGSTFSIMEDTLRHNTTLPRDSIGTPTSMSRRHFASGLETVSRSGSNASHTMTNTSKFSTVGDQLDNAYYTYSSTRFQNASTFK
uniref:Protocadherin Fat 1 n=1 Tax=Panagrellus redivivus TaxID=6233 RepID=A0A7E4VR33_PANRE